MQYPQIQFYRGSLVRLASGKLKQVEDLDSDDFLESVRLTRSTSTSLNSLATLSGNTGGPIKPHHLAHQSAPFGSAAQQVRRPGSAAALNFTLSAGVMTNGGGGGSSSSGSNGQHQIMADENNNSVFNSPEPTPSFDSPTMDIMETDDLDDYMRGGGGAGSSMGIEEEEEEDDDDDEELDVVSDHQTTLLSSTSRSNQQYNISANKHPQQQPSAGLTQISHPADDDIYIDSSVVRDFLEVGPPSSASPHHHHHHHSSNSDLNGPSTSNSPNSNSRLSGCLSPPVNQTVLIKFFIESSRNIVFIEVPVEHPFFVLHMGWSSWNPQRTFDKFGLKCRKLKIGDSCMSLIRRQKQQQQQQVSHHRHQRQQQESDQCNIMFSSFKINE